ncbi:MAG TPA: type VI secretion system tip protein TssI/VgrG [Polyangiaceae bacterium]|nr:type VI secretion system tip protein TssI/VgrG [Polyangiaceae bacterium]
MAKTRHATVVTPLPQELLLLSFEAREQLAQPFEYQLELLAESDDVDLSKLLGESVRVELELADGKTREFTGFVTHASALGQEGRYFKYRAVMRPWLWFLTQSWDCRIFQKETIPEVVKSVFRQHGFTDFETELTGQYRSLEYIVQYRESDFNFVQRLLEQEGVYYYFRHEKGRHKLVLCDSISAHAPKPGYESIPYYPPQPGEHRERDSLDAWLVSRQLQSGSLELRDFDFEKPRAELGYRSETPLGHAHDYYPRYDYPGVFSNRAEAETQTRVRLQAIQAGFELVRATGNARAMCTGYLFSLEKYPREDQNKQYLILETNYEIHVNDYETTGNNSDRPECRVELVALDAKRVFRPERRARKPIVEGPQTAIVVGYSGQEIWTDKYGRVKVQFHWDRAGKSNETSSCWVRVSQLWAGSGFGGIHIPRIGQEVIVDFLEGDPDRPIITGRVYNADNMPPYDLPRNQTQSGIKSRSSKGGGAENCNEIRFEDLKGSEELFIQAEKDQNTNVKNNQSITIGVNQTETVGANQTLTVKANQTITTLANRTVTVLANEAIQVSGTRSTNVTLADTQTYAATRTVQVAQADTLTVNGGRNVAVTGADTTTVSQGGKTTSVPDGAYGIDAKSYGVDSQSSLSLTCPSASIQAGPPAPGAPSGGPPTALTLIAQDALILQCGENVIYIGKDGISISSPSSVTALVGDNALDLAKDCATLTGKNATVTSSGSTDVMGGQVNLRKAPPKKVIKKV